MRSLLPTTLLCFVSCLSFGQTYNFRCGDFDYESNSGGGVFENVDGSGIDITISGFVADWCNGSGSFVTGINNGVNDGVVHTYEYTFSEPVDLRFSINNINVDAELPCYRDLLEFSGEPIFSDPSNVEFHGDSIVPVAPSGVLTFAVIRYENITNFTITHGDGGAICNPGYIMIANMYFTPVSGVSTIDESNESQPHLVSNFVQESLVLKGDFKTLPNISVVDMLGRKKDLAYTYNDDNITFDVSSLPNGQYFLYYEEDFKTEVARFFVEH